MQVTNTQQAAGGRQDATSERGQKQRRSRKSRRRQDVRQSQSQPQLVASAAQQTAAIFRLPACLRAPMMNLGRVIDDALDLAESLLATDFTADYRTPSIFTPPKHHVLSLPTADAPGAIDSCVRTVTPSRSGAAVQAARAVCEKLSCAAAATEAARISTQIANLKLSSTPTQQRCLSGPTHHHHQQSQGAMGPQPVPRCGSHTHRELRFCPEVSPIRAGPFFPSGATCVNLAAAAAATANSGFLTSRGPRSSPAFTSVGIAGLSSAAATAAAASAAAAVTSVTERPSPLRPLLTARPSRTAPSGALPLILHGTGMPAALSLHVPPPPPRSPLAPYHHHQHPLLQKQQQLLAQAQRQEHHQPQQVAGAAAVAPTSSARPVVPRLALTSIKQHQQSPAWQPDRRDNSTVATTPVTSVTSTHANDIGASPSEEPFLPLPLGSPLPLPSPVQTPVRGSGLSAAVPARQLGGLSSGGNPPAATAAPALKPLSPLASSAKVAAAVGITPPGEQTAAAVRVSPLAEKGGKGAVVASAAGTGPKRPVAVVPTLRLPLDDGAAAARLGAGLRSSRPHGRETQREVAGRGGGGSDVIKGFVEYGRVVDGEDTGAGMECVGTGRAPMHGAVGGQGRQPVVPGLRLGALAR
ncbi:hypothetical protein VOLCADRAFT_104522 [Volvox carteri f. nagariensis]|uniref:Uncharacterized protein n=1 Tax=Volvox carteri f. nagariensis TaxID=3068 RepID=D8TU65_VOLCA|nr:uncharacterized protein VOLCADRAFT_104522 [Volvox carteri f. nagariensis]EFJ49090.1 hypothetical protein VOLCADRAFT_104522 [Volvox carteri f. nagariensis]|eukprot:XP_002949987.1 hypothetical protein VOLCADRAFT_104522 [Volvox carteri f. nagariensis]